jgi:ribosomal protein L40E
MDITLLLLVAAFIAYRFLSDRAVDARQAARDTEKIALWRAALVRDPHSPASHESLGDALREAGRYTEALRFYETARGMMEGHEATGAGHLGGGGLDNKIRLVSMDVTEELERPKSYQAQVIRRETICRQCGALNAPDATHCAQCGKGLLSNSFLEAWHRDDIRYPILREVREGAIMVAIVLLALYLASWMPLEIKGVLLLSTIIVLVGKGLRAITDK